MHLKCTNGGLHLFVRRGPWNLFVGISLDCWLLGEPIMRGDCSAVRESGFSVARHLGAELNLLRLFVLVSIGKVGRRIGLRKGAEA